MSLILCILRASTWGTWASSPAMSRKRQWYSKGWGLGDERWIHFKSAFMPSIRMSYVWPAVWFTPCRYSDGYISVANVCGNGCNALQGRLQCFASEKGKTGTEIVSPVLDKRKGRRDTPHMGHCSPPLDLSGEPTSCGKDTISEPRIYMCAVIPRWSSYSESGISYRHHINMVYGDIKYGFSALKSSYDYISR